MRATLTTVIILVLACGPVLASPALPITKPPVSPTQWTGPPVDSHAAQGQWFKDRQTGLEEPRPYEYYDNVPSVGGGFMGPNAIYGRIMNLQLQAGVIVGFDVLATITNDMPGFGPWRDGSDSHTEFLSTAAQYEGTMYDTKLSVEFAVDPTVLTAWQTAGGSFTDPYRQGAAPFIEAENHDQLAWYCWNPGNDENLTPAGAYLVPTWDFGDILPGKTATRTLSFAAYVDPNAGDPRYDFLMNLADTLQDIFLNRTMSLKISTWIDELAIDPGAPYPLDLPDFDYPLRNSNASVFLNVPDPATLALIGAGALSVLFKRRRRT